MATLHVNGTSLECFEKGKSEPLVLVHGSASDYRTWRFQQEAFSKSFRVITYSRRYHWPNRPIPDGADYSMIEHVDDLEALITSLSASPAHLVGHSYGAFVCLLLAIRSPELVRSLVLIEPPVLTLLLSVPPKPTDLLKLLATRPRVAGAVLKFIASGIVPATKAAKKNDMEAAMRLLGKALLGRDFYQRLSEDRLNQVRANAIRAEFLGSGFPPLSARELEHLRIPALLVGSQYSARLFGCLLGRLEELLPLAERVRIENASHIAHENNASDFNEVVQTFLEKQRSKGA